MARRRPSTDVLIALGAFLALAVAVLIRRRAPVVAAAVGVGAIGLIGALGTNVNDNLVGPFFAMLFVSYSIGAHSDRHARAHPRGRGRAGHWSAARRRVRSRRARTHRRWHAPGLTLTRREGM